MAYNEQLANRIREVLVLEKVEQATEKKMFGGISFMVNDKMCIGVIGEEMMCRIDPALIDDILERGGCRSMDFTGRPMKGYLFVDQTAIKTQKELLYWINLCLAYNPMAKSSKNKA